jgi:cephalosporin hydroxylase
MNPTKIFQQEKLARIEAFGQDTAFQKLSRYWLESSMRRKYTYNFEWLGRPIIQNPVDIVAMQEIIWSVQPDLIIETGIAHGGSLIFSASMLELNAACGGPKDAEVLGVDIDIRAHNREAIETHPMFKRISMIQGSSIASETISIVTSRAAKKEQVMVFLDSNHTHDHVLAELQAYACLASVGSYCIVFDTFVEDVPADVFPDRPWGPGNNPKTAVREFLKTHPEFEVDVNFDRKLMISVAPNGYLKRVARYKQKT